METALTCPLVQNWVSENQSQNGSWLLEAQDETVDDYRSVAGEGRTLLVIIPLCRRCRAEAPSRPLFTTLWRKLRTVADLPTPSPLWEFCLEGCVLSFPFTPSLARCFPL